MRRQMMRRLTMAAFALALLPAPVMADVLRDAAERGHLRLGVRADAPPFSSARSEGGYGGYQIDLCQAIVAEVARETGKAVTAQFVSVDAGNRFRMLAEKRIDLLCEPTSVTLGRRAEIDFTIPTFVTGAGLLGRLVPGPVSLPPLGGGGVGVPAQPPRRLGVLAGTTTEAAVKALVARGVLAAQVIDMASHGDGVAALSAGLVDGYAADLEILLELRARTTNPDALVVADRLLTLETYAIGLPRGETALRLVADRAIARLYRDGGIAEIAKRHFPGREPGDAFVAMVQLNALPQ